VKLLPPGSTVRFRVRDPDGRTGSSWSAQTARNAGDVYVCHREGARWIKTSFHQSGRWRYAVTQAGRALVPGAPGYIGVINNHREIAAGWVHALRITVSVDELRSGWVERTRPRNLVEIPADVAFDSVAIDILLADDSAVALQVDHAFPVAQMARADGGLVAVLARPMDLDAPVRMVLAPQIVEALQGMRAHGWDGSACRFVVFGSDDEGYLRQIEVAAGPDGPPQFPPANPGSL
jgi:hypothetical protein